MKVGILSDSPKRNLAIAVGAGAVTAGAMQYKTQLSCIKANPYQLSYMKRYATPKMANFLDKLNSSKKISKFALGKNVVKGGAIVGAAYIFCKGLQAVFPNKLKQMQSLQQKEMAKFMDTFQKKNAAEVKSTNK